MIWFFSPVANLHEAMHSAEAARHIPSFFRFLFSNIRFLFLGLFLFFTITFTASIGLLRRKNWARLVFIGLMALGILWNVVGPEDPDFVQNFSRMFMIMRIATAVLIIGLTVLFGWIIRKLSSPAVRAEFSKAG